MVATAPRMTLSTQAVLRALIDDPEREKYGLEMSAATGLASGTLHPILARLEKIGWVESSWEDIDASKEGRPRRRYYRITSDGLPIARAALAEAHAQRVRIIGGFRPLRETS